MEQYTIQQDTPTKPSNPTSPFDSTKLFLSQVRNPSSTKSANSQRLDSIDPECLSPLAAPSISSNSLCKGQDSSHKHHKGSNLGQLKVKVFHYLQDKNEVSYQPLSEEETPSFSTSTSANTPGYVDSALFRRTSEGFISRQSSRIEISRQSSDETSASNNRESIGVSRNSQPEVAPVSSESATSTQVATENSNISSLNMENGAVQANGVNNTDHNFLDSLEFILEKTPIIKIFMTLICLALTSGISVSVIEGKDTFTFLFIVLYVFLMYLLIENTFKLFRACGTTSPTLFQIVKLEQFYNLLDGIALIVIAAVINLRLSDIIGSYNTGLYTLMGIFILYCIFSRPTIKQKLLGIAKRGIYIAQFALFMYKAEDELSISWKLAFCFGWVLLAKLLFKLVKGMIKIFNAFRGLNLLSSISSSAKCTGMIGLLLLGVDLGVFTMILTEGCRLLDSKDSDMQDLTFWLTICQYLNACLLFFTTIAGADLLEFVLSAAEHFSPFEEVDVKPKQLEISKKETFVMRMSSTYYKVVEKCEEDSIGENVTICNADKEKEEEAEDNTCYICCGNQANGVVLDCGHGGICYGCLTDYIKKKEECMECRKKVNSILKIESEVRKGELFKGEEICSIVRT